MRKLLCLLLYCIVFVTYADTIVRDPFLKSTIAATTDASISQTVKTIWIPIYFAKAQDIASFISHQSLKALSSQGSIHDDKRTNEILLQDDDAHIARIKALIAHLDKPSRQFLIAAKIINLDRNYQKTLGILFRSQDVERSSSHSLTMDEPNTDADVGEFTLTIARLAENHLLNMQISALEDEGHATLISNPSLVTLNNQSAVIESGAEVPYQETTLTGSVNVRFKKAVLSLKVTPQQMPSHHILLHIVLSQDKVSALTVKGIPAIQTQQITTQVIVKNHETIVLGGILETVNATQIEGIPGLDKIPIAGKLFERHQKTQKQEELLIFITPSVMKV